MYEKVFKRWIDFILALIATPFVMLLIIIMAPIIYINDPGPIFYNGLRRGLNGRDFKMFKFRSMYMNSPDIRNADGSTFNSSNDPRVTKVGKFMRKTSLDEVPQVLNVLCGDMSIIGPRPTLSSIPYNQMPEMKKKRYRVRPGITGYSQAYYRNSIGNGKKLKYDCYYVDHVSFIMDIKILLQTILVVLKHENVFVSENESPDEKRGKK